MSTPHGYIEKLAELASSGRPFVAVTLVESIGSAPQDAGSKMLVTTDGLIFGTVGGGRVEHQAITHAQSILAGAEQQSSATQLVEWNLQRDVGMTCGGVVKLFFEAINHRTWHVVIFGAGHVAGAVINILSTLDCRVTCIDPRAEWLRRLPETSKLTAIQVDDMAARVADLAEDDYVVCMTMGHKTDLPVLEEILRQERRFPFLGVIGSKAKRAVLRRDLLAAGIPADRVDDFQCPIGLDLGTNQPGEIAVSVVAQLIQCRDNQKK